MSRRPSLLRCLVTVGLLAGCAVSADDAPRDIDEGRLEDQVPDRTSTDPGIGDARIYLLAPAAQGQPAVLQAVARSAGETPAAVLQSLFDGPNSVETASQMRTALPPSASLLSVRLRGGGLLEIDVSPEVQRLSGEALILAVAQIVFTASALEGVRSVQISVAGAPARWPAGNGELRDVPLTVYDYPEMVRTSQPSFPPTPTPRNPA